MKTIAQDAYYDILYHIQKQGGAYSSWYCGTTENIKNRVYGDHKVPEEGHWRIYRQCTTSTAAKNVEKALLDHGCDGEPGGGDDNAVFVYAYLKALFTDP
ncbi:hypothetical protein [Desulfobacula sp.]|uniref:hypothetical protein n=1 Tax=Desulfobacula sp. TaxID=2593537 RepID=UPI00262593EB|nr:hypothetical protein [Desulfobacula sp.]